MTSHDSRPGRAALHPVLDQSRLARARLPLNHPQRVLRCLVGSRHQLAQNVILGVVIAFDLVLPDGLSPGVMIGGDGWLLIVVVTSISRSRDPEAPFEISGKVVREFNFAVEIGEDGLDLGWCGEGGRTGWVSVSPVADKLQRLSDHHAHHLNGVSDVPFGVEDALEMVLVTLLSHFFNKVEQGAELALLASGDGVLKLADERSLVV